MEPNLVLFAELLVAGIQALVWLSLLLLTTLGTNWIPRVTGVGGDFVLGVVALAFAYALGVVIDRIADRLFMPTDKRLRATVFGGSGQRYEVSKWRSEIMAWKPELGRELAYSRTRTRVARATALNLALITAVGAVFVPVRTSLIQEGRDWILLCLLVLLGLSLAALSYWSAAVTTRVQYEHLKSMRALLNRR